DGIRCRNVTGVQTCALPISPYADINATYEFQLTDAEEETYQLELSRGSASIHDSSAKEADCVLKMKEKHFRKFLQGELNSTSARSEERRVGKECSSRWQTSQ